MWFNRKQLKDAKYKANVEHLSMPAGYWWHFKLAIGEFFFLVLMCIGSLIHAFVPWTLDFKLLEARVNRLKMLKKKLPDDPTLQRIHFDE